MSEVKYPISTRSKDKFWLIGHPCETLAGARLPSGRDVMKCFFYFHRLQKKTLVESARKVYDQLCPFWTKSRLPIREKKHIIQKLKDLHGEQVSLMKNRSRNNEKDQLNQKQYTEKLDRLFDISHAEADRLMRNEEDREFLKLQKESRTGCIGSVDKKLFLREKRAAERKHRQKLMLKGSSETTRSHHDEEDHVSSSSETEDELLFSSTESTTLQDQCSSAEESLNKSDIEAYLKNRKDILTEKLSAVLDRTNTSIRKSTMILASVVNEAGCSTSSAVLSKSTVHRKRQTHRQESASRIRLDFETSKSVVHWDGKLLPDINGIESKLVDRLPVLVSSLEDGNTKLLGVPKLTSGTGQVAANAVFDLLKSWNCDSHVIGMCFDTTASNTGKINGACTFLEKCMGRNLLWLACRHHMFEVLLSDAFTVCFGPSCGPDILIFKRFREKWSNLVHPTEELKAHLIKTPLIDASDKLKVFIADHCHKKYPREDYREFISLVGLIIGLNIKTIIRKPGALHRARWMAKAIYSLKMELLYDGNEAALHLTARELQGIQRFNRFVVCIYIQSWFTSRLVADAPFNDIQLLQRLQHYDDEELKSVGIKMLKRHSWYLSQELATLSLFSEYLSCDEKSQLMQTMKTDRGSHLLQKLPENVGELRVSRSFFSTASIPSEFLDSPVETWDRTSSFQVAANFVKNLICVNDVAERGVALIQNFNATITTNEDQKQYLLQVVEKHRKDFGTCNRDKLVDM